MTFHFFIYRLVDRLIMANSLQKIGDCSSGLNAFVIWTVDLHLPHIGLHDLIRGADAFKKHALQLVLDDNPVEYIVTSLSRCVGRVKNCYIIIVNSIKDFPVGLHHQHRHSQISTN